MGRAKPSPLLSAGLMLARSGIYGMAWLDEDFVVTARFGDLTASLEVGEPMLTGLPILADYTDDIRALPADGRASFELPGILLVQSEDASAPRIDIHVLRSQASTLLNEAAQVGSGEETPSADEGQYLLLISRTSNQSGTDVALARLQRDRTILLEQIEQQKLELERTNAELELCNRDLEDFATIISHDLKAPMRALRYYADDIESALDASRPEEAREACVAMKQQSRRMSTMLSQLLDYASLGRQKDALETVDTQQLIGTIVSSLPRPPGFTISVAGDWPVIETYVAPLDLVLRNLIDNAVKHHDRPDEGQVHVEAKPAGDQLLLTISDNGPGIHSARQDAVFYPFRSYPSAPNHGRVTNEELDHGMGLAFVKRTIEAVGGELQLISDPVEQRGCEFRITWPLKASEAT